MKKVIKGILISISLLVLSLIIFAVVIIIMIHDSTNNMNQDIIDANKPIEVILEEENHFALEAANSSDPKVNYTFSEYRLNEILYAVTKDINIDPIEFHGCYAEYNEDKSLSINVPISVSFFDTLISAKFMVETTDTAFILTLKDAAVGSLNYDNWFIKNLVMKNFDIDVLNKELKKNPDFNVELEMNENNEVRMELTYEAFKDSLVKAVGNEVFGNAINALIENGDGFDVVFDKEYKGIVFDINYFDSSIPTKNSLERPEIDINKAEEYCNSKLSDGTFDGTTANAVMDFYLRGYDNISGSYKNIVKDLDLSSIIGTTNNTTYTGKVVRSSYNTDPLKDQFPSEMEYLTTTEFDITISDDYINATLGDAFVGETLTFVEGNDLNYLSLGYIYLTNKKGSPYNTTTLSFVLDINGNEIKFDFGLSSGEMTNNYKITGYISEMSAGNLKINEKDRNEILKYLATNLTGSNLITIDNNLMITLNFEKLLTDAGFVGEKSDALKTFFDSKLAVTDGGIKITYTKK